MQPEEYACVTIFFSDIVGYTTISSGMAPHLVMSLLDRLYTKFDALSERLIFVLTKLVISLTN